jgi:hypothetical protein
MNKFIDSLGPPSVRTNNFRQLIRKCLTLALPVQTSPTAHLHLHHHGGALHGEILKMTEVSAVPTCRRRAALGTGAYFRSHRRDHPTIAVSLDPKNPHVRPGSPIHVLSHACLSARRPINPTSTESEADPDFVQRDTDILRRYLAPQGAQALLVISNLAELAHCGVNSYECSRAPRSLITASAAIVIESSLASSPRQAANERPTGAAPSS